MKKMIVIALSGGIALLFFSAFLSTMNAGKKDIHFNHLAIFVYDLEVSKTFYREVLQLEPIPEPFHDNKHTWFHIGEHGQLHIISGNQKEQTHIKDIHIAFSISSIEEFIKHLDKEKINYTNWTGDKKSAGSRADGVKQVYFQDPDGYWIEVNDEFPAVNVIRGCLKNPKKVTAERRGDAEFTSRINFISLRLCDSAVKKYF